MGKVLGGLARRQDDYGVRDAGRREGRRQGVEVEIGDRFVGDDDDPRLRQQWADARAGAGQQPIADMNIVGTCAEVDADAFFRQHLGGRRRPVRRGQETTPVVWFRRSRCAVSAASTRSVVNSAGSSLVSTTRSASA